MHPDRAKTFRTGYWQVPDKVQTGFWLSRKGSDIVQTGSRQSGGLDLERVYTQLYTDPGSAHTMSRQRPDKVQKGFSLLFCFCLFFWFCLGLTFGLICCYLVSFCCCFLFIFTKVIIYDSQNNMEFIFIQLSLRDEFHIFFLFWWSISVPKLVYIYRLWSIL